MATITPRGFISTACIWNFGFKTNPKHYRRYRFRLERIWDDNLPLVAFIGLNPSKADEVQTDNTVTRCVGFAQRWGFGGLYMLNAFAFRATNPKEMKQADWPIGVGNDNIIKKTMPNVTRVVLCWGSHAKYRGRSDELRELLLPWRKMLYAFAFNKDGEPQHPLYLPNDTRLKKVRL